MTSSKCDGGFGSAARVMIAQDARWAADALLSTQSAGDASGVLPFALMGHSARIVYEGSVAIRSSNIDNGLPELAELLEDRYAGVVARARHAGKFLDDSKKALSLVPELPMFGIVESLYPGGTFDDLNEDVPAMASRLGETMNDWKT